MKGGLEILVLVVAAVIVCGCTDQGTTRVNQPDPIVGVWIEDLMDINSPYIVTFTFFADGTFTAQIPDRPIPGHWTRLRENQYVVTYDFAEETRSFIYDPDSDTLSEPQYPSLTIYRALKMPISTTIAQTSIATPNPTR
ncbi:hypothetical protein J2741_002138 [Methanolinea mesophila]|uniref:hypothetical protein n=1 Tax=Methanolinea mesophila TaxID=547055 RepID=UPI001AE1DF66|nr:hypothetical protein [Methanolinea mesophila]MBP1929591.1 hypothetical protein [Methanolinea mesophila]